MPNPPPGLVLAGLLLGALALAAAYSSTSWQPLHKPGGEPVPAVLQHTIATAWAAMFISMPAFCAFFFRNKSITIHQWWLTFWSVGSAVFLVHFVQAVFIYFKHDWTRILHSDQVTMPVVDTFLTVWWLVDVVIALLGIPERNVVLIQRWTIHLLLLAVFLVGAIVEGHYPASRVVGAFLGLPALAAISLGLSRIRLKKPLHIFPKAQVNHEP